MELSSAGNHVPIGRLRLLNLKGNITIELLEQTITDHTRSKELALTASKGGLVHTQSHTDGGLLNSDGRKGLVGVGAVLLIGQKSITNLDIVETAEHDNLTSGSALDLLLAQVIENKELCL
jgi:hypothetical protein